MQQTVIDYTYIQNTIWKLKATYPMIRVCRIGKSVVGRSIYSLELGRQTAPPLLFLGTFTGQDAITGELLLTWFGKVAKAVMNNEKVNGVVADELISRYRIVVIPFVNPDGREICQRGAHCAGIDSGKIKQLSLGDTTRWDANARGVDITQNFDFRFGIRRKTLKAKGVYSPCAKGYTGPYPESEPETVAITSYCRNQGVHRALCLYPGKGRIFWKSSGADPELTEKQANVLGVVTGYDVEAGGGLVVDSGFRNWFAQTFRKPAFDIMVCSQKDDPYYHVLQETLTLSCLF